MSSPAVTPESADQKALEALVKLLESADEGFRLEAAKTILNQRR